MNKDFDTVQEEFYRVYSPYEEMYKSFSSHIGCYVTIYTIYSRNYSGIIDSATTTSVKLIKCNGQEYCHIGYEAIDDYEYRREQED